MNTLAYFSYIDIRNAIWSYHSALITPYHTWKIMEDMGFLNFTLISNSFNSMWWWPHTDQQKTATPSGSPVKCWFFQFHLMKNIEKNASVNTIKFSHDHPEALKYLAFECTPSNDLMCSLSPRGAQLTVVIEPRTMGHVSWVLRKVGWCW